MRRITYEERGNHISGNTHAIYIGCDNNRMSDLSQTVYGAEEKQKMGMDIIYSRIFPA